MAKTNAQTQQQRKARTALYQRRRREGMRERGRPETVATDYALVEALSFLTSKSLVSTFNADAAADPRSLTRTLAIPLWELKAVTLDILVRREGYARSEAKIALHQRLGFRKDHGEPWYVPSLRPDPEAQEARVRQAAEERAGAGRAAE